MPDIPDIFISYAREDKERVKRIVAAMEKQGWRVFWDRDIPVGQTWRSYIGNALENACCIVVVWSKHSIESRWVPQEADEASHRMVYVPVLLDDVLPPLGLRDTQAADLTSWNHRESDSQFILLKNAIASFVPQKKAGPASKAPSEVPLQPAKTQKEDRQEGRALDSGLKGLQQNSDARQSITMILAVIVMALFLVVFFHLTSGPGIDSGLAAIQRIDIDGNIYKTVKIGNQTWMAENLKVNCYRNGDPIPQVQDPKKWGQLTTGAWCYYENDTAHGKVYGKLYNWYAVNDPRGLAPEGWHVPSDGEWKELERFLGMSWEDTEKTKWRGSIGGKLKKTGLVYWRNPNTGATNESGFTAMAGGDRYKDGAYHNHGLVSAFWSSSPVGDKGAWGRVLNNGGVKVCRLGIYKQDGLSVRCIRD